MNGRRLLIDVVLPLGTYYLLHACGLDDLLALSIGSGIGLVTAGAALLRTRRIELLSAVTLLSLLIGLAIALVSDDARQLLIRSAWVSAPLAVITLASLRSDRPLTYVVTSMLLHRKRPTMERLWDAEPAFRAAWRHITIAWGLAALADAAARVVVAYSFPIPAVPAIDLGITLVTMLVLQLPTHLFLRRSGFWTELFGQPSSRSRRQVAANSQR